jgi:hypothetical protein
MLSEAERSRNISKFQIKVRDLMRSLPVRSTSGLPVYVAASPAAPFSTSLGMTRRVELNSRSHSCVEQFDRFVNERITLEGFC